MKDWKNRIIWIIGASSGIGRSLAIEFAKKGAKLILSSRQKEILEKVGKELESNNYLILPLDLVKTKTFTKKVEEAFKWQNKIDCVIHSGGVSQRGLAYETSLDVDRTIMEINYFGMIALTKNILPYFHNQGYGYFVPISSIAGKFGFYLRSAYSASKHAIQGFFESLLLEEADRNIKITLVFPGKINTPISISALNKEGKPHLKIDQNQKKGMSSKQCAIEIIKAIEKEKKEILIGNKEIKAVKLKNYFPSIFWKIIAKQSPR